MTRPRRARKGPITQVITRHITKPPLSSKAAQATISAYHVLLKKRDRLLVRRRSQGGSRSSPELKQVEAEIEALGGLDAYQQASIMGQSTVRGGDSSRVLIPWLKERRDRTGPGQHPGRLRMLEIGALLPDNMAECSPDAAALPSTSSARPQFSALSRLASALPLQLSIHNRVVFAIAYEDDRIRAGCGEMETWRKSRILVMGVASSRDKRRDKPMDSKE
ncbi:hypothetical protein M231_05574 [Tremella mesenterica]|uniref:Uncharacterized protein n=1 Tax=Tremella mesenterica TaxID=5217 RepID=A0A4Q1BHN6_TREME|nr:hypothetical protein M231_05574 [Tremella mesenterica]